MQENLGKKGNTYSLNATSGVFEDEAIAAVLLVTVMDDLAEPSGSFEE